MNFIGTLRQWADDWSVGVPESYCHDCATLVRDDVDYCPQCGAALEAVDVPAVDWEPPY